MTTPNWHELLPGTDAMREDADMTEPTYATVFLAVRVEITDPTQVVADELKIPEGWDTDPGRIVSRRIAKAMHEAFADEGVRGFRTLDQLHTHEASTASSGLDWPPRHEAQQ